MVNIVNKIISNFSNNNSLYIGENLTIANHMIQTAMLAEKNKSSDNLICSSLLHDYGHFIIDNPDKLINDQINGNHEFVGANYLKEFFPTEIINPILLHVDAKRFLSRDSKYFNNLSEASKISLKVQGGIMKDKEAKNFKKNTDYMNAIKLRRFDEGAKKLNIKIKSIEDYKELLISKVI